jgi:survival-of-motor-neuron-related-splicing factor 30
LREYQKKKKQKKLQRYKQMEEEREGEKNKWLAFNSNVGTLFGTVIVTNYYRGEFIL